MQCSNARLKTTNAPIDVTCSASSLILHTSNAAITTNTELENTTLKEPAKLGITTSNGYVSSLFYLLN